MNHDKKNIAEYADYTEPYRGDGGHDQWRDSDQFNYPANL
jgi:hypothetical protein